MAGERQATGMSPPIHILQLISVSQTLANRARPASRPHCAPRMCPRCSLLLFSSRAALAISPVRTPFFVCAALRQRHFPVSTSVRP